MIKEIKYQTLENKISASIAKDIKICTGKGPINTETFINEKYILIKLEGLMFPTEVKLADSEMGYYDVKINRIKWIEVNKELLIETITNLTDRKCTDFYYDINPKANSSVLVIFNE